MRIRMVTERTGSRHDGQDWPPRGGEIDVPDDEGAALCEHGDAVPVARHDAAETPEDGQDAAAETRASGAAGEPSTSAAAPEPAPKKGNASAGSRSRR